MRMHLTLIIVVLLALGAGIASFTVTTPDQRRRPPAHALGFTQLTPETVRAAALHSAAHHRAADRLHRTELAARGAASAWLSALPGSRATPATSARSLTLAPADPTAEQHEAAGRTSTAFTERELSAVIDAFGRAESGVAAALTAAPDAAFDAAPGSLQRTTAHATVAWIEATRGHGALLRLLGALDQGVEPQRALRAIVGRDARGVEIAVARWIRTVAATPGIVRNP